MSLPMIDVSSNNHPTNLPINWSKVRAAGYQGVIIKCTEGTSYVNPWAKIDAVGANQAGLHVGFYHFCRPGLSSGAQQAEFAMKTINGWPRDIGLSCDLEDQGGLDWPTLSNWAPDFINTVAKAAIGSPIYLNQNFLNNLSGAPWGHKLWFASPDRAPRMNCWMWQKSWTGSVPGIVGQVDIDQYNG